MEEIKKILLLGGGGHCLSVLDSLLSSYHYESIGIVEKKVQNQIPNHALSSSLPDIPIVGCDEDLEELFGKGYTDAFITLGSTGDSTVRRKLYNRVKEIGFHIPNIIDKSSIVSRYATLGEGIFIGKQAIVNASAKIGNMAIINTSSVIEHECVIGDFVHIAPGSVLCGGVEVGDNTHIGAGSVLKQGIHIGANTIIGMGSVVVKDMGNQVVAYGNPCKEKNR